MYIPIRIGGEEGGDCHAHGSGAPEPPRAKEKETVMGEPIRILISSCLLGDMVRYDGGHKREGFLVETLGRFVEWVPVCPEVDCGLPTPREAMRLVGNSAAPRLGTSGGGGEHTERVSGWGREKRK